MEINPGKLAQHLKGPLSPLYLVIGDEALLREESADAIRQAARAEGYDERTVFDVDNRFDWDEAFASANNLSLFSDRRLLEFRAPRALGDKGTKAVRAYCDAPAQDTLVMVRMEQFEARQRNTQWYKAVVKAGTVVRVWPVPLPELPGWINQRMARAGLAADADAVRWLAEATEGNLLATAQEIQKLLLVAEKGHTLTLDDVIAAVADSTFFTAFDLIDAALAGNARRAERILGGLREQGTEPLMISGALARELRILASLIAAGRPSGRAMARFGVWDRRQPLVARALARHEDRSVGVLMDRLRRVDFGVKGASDIDPWDELSRLVAELAAAGAGYFPRIA